MNVEPSQLVLQPTRDFPSEAEMDIPRSLLFASVVAIVALTTLFAAVPLKAQVDRSALTGTVMDPSGRLVARAHVTAVENSTRLRREGSSDAVGRYGLAELPVGRYTVTIDHPGFETLTFTNVEQVVGANSNT